MGCDVTYLRELGYTEEEIRAHEQAWAEGILEYLSDNRENVLENMRALRDGIDRRLLPKLTVYYPEAFVLPPARFRRHLSVLQAAFPDAWAEIIKKQFWADDGTDPVYMTAETVGDGVDSRPFLETVGADDARAVEEAVRSLKEPSTRVYKFIEMLRIDAGLDVTAEDIPEECLQDLEVGRYEVADCVAFLQVQNVPDAAIREILTCNPLLLFATEAELDERLRAAFGERYAETLESLSEEELENALYEM